jgi:nudix-type nucleoside diphosphatase (YffH/AdpP family)
MNRPLTPDPESTADIKMIDVQILANDWFVLKKNVFDYRRSDGTWQRLSRETYDRGNGATVLLFNAVQQTVVLTKQFRFPAFANGHSNGMLIEACAGLLDGVDAATRIQHEIREELGFQINQPKKVFEAYMSPGSVTEKLHFFVASYTTQDRHDGGGGIEAEGEDIEVLELPLVSALDMISTGQIEDGKTIMLLLHAALIGLDRL